jgi:hypothetical protein
MVLDRIRTRIFNPVAYRTYDVALPLEEVRCQEGEQSGDGEGFARACLSVGQHGADPALG